MLVHCCCWSQTLACCCWCRTLVPCSCQTQRQLALQQPWRRCFQLLLFLLLLLLRAVSLATLQLLEQRRAADHWEAPVADWRPWGSEQPALLLLLLELQTRQAALPPLPPLLPSSLPEAPVAGWKPPWVWQLLVLWAPLALQPQAASVLLLPLPPSDLLAAQVAGWRRPSWQRVLPAEPVQPLLCLLLLRVHCCLWSPGSPGAAGTVLSEGVTARGYRDTDRHVRKPESGGRCEHTSCHSVHTTSLKKNTTVRMCVCYTHAMQIDCETHRYAVVLHAMPSNTRTPAHSPGFVLLAAAMLVALAADCCSC